MSKAAQSNSTEDRIERYSQRTLGPYEVSEELTPTIDELDLWTNVNELRDQGYTVVKNVCEPELMDDLREVIHTFSEQTEGPTKGYTASMLLGRHPVVDRVATLPKILALTEVSVGKGMRAGQFIGSIKREGMPALGLHADQKLDARSFPEHNLLLTFCIPCEGMTAEGAPPPSYQDLKASGVIRRAKNWKIQSRYPLKLKKDPSLYGTDLCGTLLALERFLGLARFFTLHTNDSIPSQLMIMDIS